MNTPDTVGGLPELPAWMDDYKIPCDAFDGDEDVRLSDRMRAYGELCRAAPAGGDACEVCGKPFRADVPINACACAHLVINSAPAGSGEAEDEDVEGLCQSLDLMAEGRDAQGMNCDAEVLRCAAALLRKLQQGADGWRPIESAPKEDGLKILGASNATWTQDYYPVLVYEGYRYGSNKQYFGWQAPFDHDDRAPDPTHWMPLPAPPASQDQDGGKHG